MRFSIGTAFLPAALYIPIAQAAEECGFEAIKVADSICYPEVSDSVYPYSPDGSREFLDGKPFLDPFCAIAAMGAVTTNVRFVTSVLKLPMRHPVLVAKQAASAAALTGNRVALGVGSSPWPDDYLVLGVPVERRGQRMDEAIDVIRGLFAGGYFEYHGEIFDIPSIKIDPVPSEPVPMFIGGHAEGSLRRAARAGDGWIAATSARDTLPQLIGRLTALRAEYGRANIPFEVHIGIRDAEAPDVLYRLADLGVTDVTVSFTYPYAVEDDARSLPQRIDAMRRYADGVMSRVRDRVPTPAAD
jgi:probable F420-dependent oxidoreductase